MTREEIETTVRAHLATLFEESEDPPKIETQSHLREDLGLDSIEAVSLVFQIEDHFDIELTDEEAMSLDRVVDVVELVHAKIGSRSDSHNGSDGGPAGPTAAEPG